MRSAFRRGELIDPVIFGRNMAKVFMCYPRQIVLIVCDPTTGVPAVQDWLPSIAQVKAACDTEIAYLHRVARYRNWGNRATLELAKDEPVKPTMQQLKAKFGPNWGIKTADEENRPESRSAMSKEQLQEHYSKYNLGKKIREES
jgi:hypothetical protein